MARLAGYTAQLRRETGRNVPEADPLDGGEVARVLLLLETPGPRTMRTGFVSRDNAGGTSANLRRALDGAGLARAAVLIWNVVPWVIHTGGPNRAPTTDELRRGLALLPGWLDLLPALRVAVLAGRKAEAARPVLHAHRPALPVIAMPHPSPTIVNTHPSIRLRIEAALAEAARHVDREADYSAGAGTSAPISSA